MIVEIYYTFFSYPLPKKKFDELLYSLPNSLIEINNKYIKWEDKHAHLFGKLLLRKAWGSADDILKRLKLTENNRPYVNTEIDFNIAHSGGYVMCAITKGHRVGIDVEEIVAIDPTDFQCAFNNQQLDLILHSHDIPMTFFSLWVKKECMIKADGRGVQLPINSLFIENETILFEGKTWYLKEVPTRQGYCSCICSDSTIQAIQLKLINFYDLNY